MANDPECVQVAVRIRPLVENEIEKGCQKIIEKIDNEPQVIVRGDYNFTYNHVFDSEDPQELIYKKAVYNNLQKLFLGYNVTILAYGQTGSGKTHTMGTTFDGLINEDIGIIPRTTFDIFKEIQFMSAEFTFIVKCSFMELYQEQLYDLLSSSPRDQSIVDIREDHKGIIIPGLTEIPVNSANEIIECLMKGSSGRAVGATAMNAQSSRSHAIFTVIIQKTKIDDANVQTTSKFHLVDLAGSERPKKTKATGDRFREGVKINQGLLALGNVISALGTGQACGYVGYRDSKLTRLLQDSLGGNSVTLMIACVSPADYNLDETLSTLRYADRARKIKNKPIINQDPKSAEINRLNGIIEKLRLELLLKMGPSENGNVNGLNKTNSNNGENEDLKNTEEMRKNINVLVEKNHNLQKQLQLILNDVTEIEMRATLAESSKEQFEQKLLDVKEAVIKLSHNLKETKCNEHDNEIKELLEIVNNIEECIAKNKEEMADQKASFSSTNLSSTTTDYNHHNQNQSIIPNEILHTNDVQQKYDAFTTKQLNFNNELRKLNRELCLKEELHQKIAKNLENFYSYENSNIDNCHSIIKSQNFEEHLKKLEAERDELINERTNCFNKTNNASAKISEERRKRLQQLEQEINELKKKNLQQAKMLKLREKESQKIVNLSKEIQEMKSARVKLIREMKNESDKFKQWKLAKEKEVFQLKEKDRKRENEFVRMKALHDKQRNVLKRKMEEAIAVNKRLKDTLDKTKSVQSQRKALNSGKIDHILSWIDHELEVIISVTDAEYSLEHLMEDRAILTNRLNEIKQLDPNNIQEINSIEDELSMRNIQISDLQQKIIDTNIENKIQTLSDSMQSMLEAKAAVKRLFTNIIDTRKEFVSKENKYKDMKIMYEITQEKCNNYEKNIHDLIMKHNEEKANIEKAYEEKITILLRELNHVSPVLIQNGENLTTEMSERLKIQQDALDRYEEMRDELEKYKNLCEDLQDQMLNNEQITLPNKRIRKLRQTFFPNIINIDLEQTATEDEQDDDKNDPDWRKTPLHKLRSSRSSHIQHNNTFKRSSDGTIKCGCKHACTTKLCSCKKNNISCSHLCKCSDICINNKSMKQEQLFEETTDSSSDNKENFDNNASSEEHTPPKVTKLSITFNDKDIPTPSYPYSRKKRKPFYNN